MLNKVDLSSGKSHAGSEALQGSSLPSYVSEILTGPMYGFAIVVVVFRFTVKDLEGHARGLWPSLNGAYIHHFHPLPLNRTQSVHLNPTATEILASFVPRQQIIMSFIEHMTLSQPNWKRISTENLQQAPCMLMKLGIFPW